MTKKPIYTKLQNRGVIHIEGKDRNNFLQGLITNDVGKLTAGLIVYACLLNAQGKFLHDFFMHAGDEFILLDCEGGERAQDLYNRLNMYRLRSDVQISIEGNAPIYATIGAPIGLPDPRHPDMGYRSFEKPTDIDECSFDVWDRHRIMCGVPDGSRDMVTGKTTMLESRIDTLNGVDFEKGCYIGQELTARMHYRGLAKKHLYAIQGTLPEHGTVLKSKEERAIGEMRSSCGDVGLAVLKDTMIDKVQSFKVIQK